MTDFLRITKKDLYRVWGFVGYSNAEYINVEIRELQYQFRKARQDQVSDSSFFAFRYEDGFSEAFNKLSIGAQNVLRYLGVGDIDSLLSIKRKDLTHVWDYVDKISTEITNLQFRLRKIKDLRFVRGYSYESQYEGTSDELFEVGKGNTSAKDLTFKDDLSSKAQNIIRQLHVKDIYSFLSITLADLYNIEDCDRKTILEIRILQSKLKKLKGHQVVKDSSSASQYGNIINKLTEAKKGRPIASNSVFNNLSIRAQKVLKFLGVKDVPDLLKVERNDLIKIEGCGKKTISEISALQFRLKQQF